MIHSSGNLQDSDAQRNVYCAVLSHGASEGSKVLIKLLSFWSFM